MCKFTLHLVQDVQQESMKVYTFIELKENLKKVLDNSKIAKPTKIAILKELQTEQIFIKSESVEQSISYCTECQTMNKVIVYTSTPTWVLRDSNQQIKKFTKSFCGECLDNFDSIDGIWENWN